MPTADIPRVDDQLPREHTDFKKALRPDEVQAGFLHDASVRAEARLVPFVPVTPEDRLKWFAEMGFRPHGLYVPEDPIHASKLRSVTRKIGEIPQLDQRNSRYMQLQDKTEQWAASIAGAWTGQQAIARSRARFRAAAFGRRGGKSTYGAAEAVGVAKYRPGSTVWIAAPVMDPLVRRIFDKVTALVDQLEIPMKIRRDSAQTKLLVFENGSQIEGVTLEQITSIAGAAVDFLVVDEVDQIDEETWVRALVPPLMDRNGQALLIGSFEGAEGFLSDKIREAKKKAGTWEVFEAASYDVNFFVFPKGQQTEALVDARKEMDPLEFLEQFGAIPNRGKGRVYSTFKERVHVGRYDFNPNLPVYLCADPSGGAAPYAVLAIQDYGEAVVAIDEYYEERATVEVLAPQIDRAPWREAVVEMVVDSAWPSDIERWTKHGFPAFAVFEKPKIPERLPFHRNALRDPIRFFHFYRQLVNQILVGEMGMEPESDLHQDEDFQYALALQVETLLSDEKLSDDYIQKLRACARLFIDQRCSHFIEEHRLYRYRKAVWNRGIIKEVPDDKHNHLMDAFGYYLWQYKRFDTAFAVGDQSFVQAVTERVFGPALQAIAERALTEAEIPRGFLTHMRERHDSSRRVVDFVRAV